MLLTMLRCGRTLRTSVFRSACAVALANALCAGCLKALDLHGPEGARPALAGTLSAPAVYSCSFLVGIFMVLRASQAYGHFWDGAELSFQVVAGFFDVVSSLCAFSRFAKVEDNMVLDWKHTVVRLFSTFHALILAELEAVGRIAGTESALDLEVVDLTGLDERTLTLLQQSEEKVDLVFHWIQVLIVHGMESGIISVPPSIVTRAFQELNECMVNFNQALKLTEVPIPFPYTAVTEVLLILHWVLTVLASISWTSHIWDAALCAFAQALVVWSLGLLAAELESSLGNDESFIARRAMHMELNTRLLMLFSEHSMHVPSLAPGACKEQGNMRASMKPVRELYSGYDLAHSAFGLYSSRAARQVQCVSHVLKARPAPRAWSGPGLRQPAAAAGGGSGPPRGQPGGWHDRHDTASSQGSSPRLPPSARPTGSEVEAPPGVPSSSFGVTAQQRERATSDTFGLLPEERPSDGDFGCRRLDLSIARGKASPPGAAVAAPGGLGKGGCPPPKAWP